MFVWICVSNVEFIAAVSQVHRFMQLTGIMQLTDLTNHDALRKKFLPITAVESNIKVINPNEFFFFNWEDPDLGFHFSESIKTLSLWFLNSCYPFVNFSTIKCFVTLSEKARKHLKPKTMKVLDLSLSLSLYIYIYKLCKSQPQTHTNN